MTTTDPSPDTDDESNGMSPSEFQAWALLFSLGLYVVVAHSRTDPLDDLRQRVATLEGKVSR